MEKRVGSTRVGGRCASSGDPAIGLHRPILVHPALLHLHGRSSSPGPLRAPTNLKDEGDILRYGLGLFSALAFLEAEGWPRRPHPGGWAMGEDGMPALSGYGTAPRENGEEGTANPVLSHAALLARLLGAKRAEVGGSRPPVPRRHRSAAGWNEWFSGLVGEDGTASARAGLLGLWELADRWGFKPGIPSTWGIGFTWSPSPSLSTGIQTFGCPNPLALSAALASWADGVGGALRPVHMPDITPYPFSALEPLAAAALGEETSASAWMRDHLGGGEAAMVHALCGLLDGSGGWLLWPAVAVDEASLKVLDRASSKAGVPVHLLECDEGSGGDTVPSGDPSHVHLLWLPPRAQVWYLEHAEALLGPDPHALLDSLARLPSDQPRGGGPLLPPLPADLAAPSRGFLGNWPEKPRVRSAGTPAATARGGRLAELLVSARRMKGDSGEHAEGLFWEGAVLCFMGQPALALQAWRSEAPAPGTEGRLAVFRTRAHDWLQDRRAARKALEEARKFGLNEEDAMQAELAHGQLLWVEGKGAEAEKRFTALVSTAADGNVRAQALCHLATFLLLANRPAEALVRLEEARYALPEPPEPLTEFLLAHRTGLALRKTGDFNRALAHFEAARGVAAGCGFRSLEAWAECEAGNALCQLRRFTEGEAAYRRAEEGAAGLGLQALRESARFDLALCQVDAGNLTPAERTFQAALDRTEEGCTPVSRAVDCYWLGVVRYQRGDFPGALELVERGLEALGELRDPEVRLPLLVLRGEILFSTGQFRKLGFLLRTLESELREESEPNDRLAAMALKRIAASRGEGAFTEAHLRAAEELLEKASMSHRAHWWLLSAQAARENQLPMLEQAWRLAKEAGNAHLACRVLWAMAELGSVPTIQEADRSWLWTFITQNRLRGVERNLLPHLGLLPPSAPAAAQNVPEHLALLARAEKDAAQTLDDVLMRVGASCGCMLEPGRGPSWWGEGPAEVRLFLADSAGLAGVVRANGGSVLGHTGRDGIWCGFYRPGRDGFSEEAAAFIRVWTSLFRPPQGGINPSSAVRLHPAIEKIVVTQSPAMAPLLARLDRAAAFTYPVLITGEAGSGKEVCARAIHAASSRSGKPWFPTNCANLTATLAASLLFGHRKGAFTGADRDKAGLVEAARGSTLFLDEVGELPREAQSGLLRYFQDGSYTPLGDTAVRRSDARVVTATNMDLERAVEDGRFREDLYHRINVIRVEVPALRQRPEDIPLLFAHFLAEASREAGVAVPDVAPEVLPHLSSYRWPGNVRELQNLARALLVESHGCPAIQEAHLPLRMTNRTQRAGRTLAERLRTEERAAIEEALKGEGGSLSAAGRVLGISRQSLAQKMKRLGVRREA